jgi:MFS family permease
MPFVQPELGLSNTQVGMVASVFSFIWAIAAFGVSRVSDAIGNRKLLLVIATAAFSACSFLTGLAATFAMLIGARILMGLAEGGVMPISHAMVASEVDPKMRGLRKAWRRTSARTSSARSSPRWCWCGWRRSMAGARRSTSPAFLG